MKRIVKLWITSLIFFFSNVIYNAAPEDIKSEQEIVSDPAGTQSMSDAIRQNNKAAVQYWLSKIGQGQSLAEAVSENNLDMVKFLASKGVNLNIRLLLYGPTALMRAAELGYFPIVEYLVQQKVSLNALDNKKKTALSYAVSNRHFDIANYLLDHGADSNFLLPALEDAIYEKQFEIIDYIIVQRPGGMNVSWADWTLEIATRKGALDIVQHVLNKTSYNRKILEKAWEKAIAYNQLQILDYLSEVDKQGMSNALIEATKKGNLHVLQYLIVRKGADVNTKNEQGNTVLSVAMRAQKFSVVILLIKHGAIIHDSYQLLHLAVKQKNVELIRALFARGVVDVIHDTGDTTLTAFVKQRDYPAVTFLIEHGANPYQKDRLGLHAFQYAENDPQMLSILSTTTKHEEPSEEEMKELGAVEKRPKGGRVGTMTRRMQHIQRAMEPQRHEEEKEAAQELGFVAGYPTQTEAHLKEFRAKIEQRYGDVLADPLVKKIMQQENIASQKGDYVFYTAQPGKYRIYQYFIESVYRLINLYSTQDPFVWNRFFKDAAQEKTIEGYIQSGRVQLAKQLKPEENVVLSANIALFGNIDIPSSCTWDYFLKNKEMAHVSLETLFKRIFDKYGFNEKYKQQLLNLDQGALINSATLQQIIIPKSIVDEVAMIAAVGYAKPWPKMIDPSSWDEGLKRHTKISPILDQYKAGTLKIDDAWQARILMNAVYGLNPESGIKIYSYTRLPDVVLSALKDKVDVIVAQMFKEWLEKELQREQVSESVVDENVSGILQYPVIRRDPATGEEEYRLRKRVLSTRQQKNIVSLQVHRPASVWQEYSSKGSVSAQELRSLFIQDCARDADQNNSIPQKNSGITRIATYNVHKWLDPNSKKNQEQIVEVIKLMNADILVLQEVTSPENVRVLLEQMEYMHQIFMITSEKLGNMILSKYPLIGNPVKKLYKGGEDRNVINVVTQLPDGTHLSVYGTHLDVRDESGKRRVEQVKELIAIAQTDPHQNIVLAADWNAVRERDYQYEVEGKVVWDLARQRFVERSGERLGIQKIPTESLEYVEESGFKDCFSRGGFAGPAYTVWTGTVVDFMFCSFTWNLPIAGCYVYYNAASDHLPVIMDIALTQPGQTGEEEKKAQAVKTSRKRWQSPKDLEAASAAKPIRGEQAIAPVIGEEKKE